MGLSPTLIQVPPSPPPPPWRHQTSAARRCRRRRRRSYSGLETAAASRSSSTTTTSFTCSSPSIASPPTCPSLRAAAPASSRQPSSLCLFFDDRSPSASASASALLDRARAFSLPVDTAIGLSSLRSDYRPYEARRRLCDSHDLFFADRRVVPLLPRFIGKEFFRKKKAPLPLDLSRPGWPQQLRRCLNSAFLHPPCKGTCAVVKVGRVSMTPEEIADNVVAVVEGAVEHVPKGWANLRSVLVKAVDSVALPIYQAVPQMGMKIDVQALLTSVGKGEDLKHGDEDEDGEVVDDEEMDVQFSSQKNKQKKGRIHELLTGYIKMVEKGDDTVDVSLDENVEAGTDDDFS